MIPLTKYFDILCGSLHTYVEYNTKISENSFFYSVSFHFLNLCVLNIKNSMDSLTTSYIRKKRFMIKYQRLKKSIEKPLISLSRWQFYQFSSIFNVNNVKSGCLCRHFLHGRLNWCCFDRSSTRSVFRYTRTQIYTYTCI